MGRYVTLGADEHGQVYGLELNDDGTWRSNPLGCATSCVVIRPMNKETYEYVTEDPESAKDLWKQCVEADKTEEGLEEWFEEYVSGCDVPDRSWVFELLDDDDNPTVSKHNLSIRKRMDEDVETDESDDIVSSDGIWDENGQPMSFRRRVELALVESDDVTSVDGVDDVYEWESSGWYPPERPFVVEFAPREILDRYYESLESHGKFKR